MTPQEPASAFDELDPIFRMPAVLGPAPGPRNMPKDKAHLRFDGETRMLSVVARTDAARLTQLLPPGCSLLGEPLIEVQVHCQKNLGWLAGRGYNIIALRIPVRFEGRESFDANFTPVLWESMADPVLTGREELGSPKLFATIPDPLGVGDDYAATAEWEGFRFFELAITGLKASGSAPPANRPNLLYKYFGRTGEWEKSDVAYMTRAVPGEAPSPQVREHLVGVGSFAFHAPRWEDMPTQYTFVQTLASLPILECVAARCLFISGIPDLRAQAIVD